MRLGLGLGLARRRGGATSDTLSPTPLTATLAADGLSTDLVLDENVSIVGTVNSSDFWNQFSLLLVLGGGGTSNVARNAASISSATVTLNHPDVPVARDWPVTIAYAKGGDSNYWLKDAAGNYVDDFTAIVVDSSACPVDSTAPEIYAVEIYWNGSAYEMYCYVNDWMKNSPTPNATVLTLNGTSAATQNTPLEWDGASAFYTTLAGTVYQDETVTLDYSNSGTEIQDLAGNDLANFTNMAVDNQSTEPGP